MSSRAILGQIKLFYALVYFFAALASVEGFVTSRKLFSRFVPTMPHRLIAAPLGSLMYTVTANALSHSNAQNAPPAVKVGFRIPLHDLLSLC